MSAGIWKGSGNVCPDCWEADKEREREVFILYGINVIICSEQSDYMEGIERETPWQVRDKRKYAIFA